MRKIFLVSVFLFLFSTNGFCAVLISYPSGFSSSSYLPIDDGFSSANYLDNSNSYFSSRGISIYSYGSVFGLYNLSSGDNSGWGIFNYLGSLAILNSSNAASGTLGYDFRFTSIHDAFGVKPVGLGTTSTPFDIDFYLSGTLVDSYTFTDYTSPSGPLFLKSNPFDRVLVSRSDYAAWGVDNITFGTSAAAAATPEPATISLGLLSAGAAGWAVRRRRLRAET